MLQCGLFRSNFSLAIVYPSSLSRASRIGVERVAGIEPASSAWKAAALPLCYTRETPAARRLCGNSALISQVHKPFGSSGQCVVGEVGLEPTKAMPADLQSAPFAARDIPPCAPSRNSASPPPPSEPDG